MVNRLNSVARCNIGTSRCHLMTFVLRCTLANASSFAPSSADHSYCATQVRNVLRRRNSGSGRELTTHLKIDFPAGSYARDRYTSSRFPAIRYIGGWCFIMLINHICEDDHIGSFHSWRKYSFRLDTHMHRSNIIVRRVFMTEIVLKSTP